MKSFSLRPPTSWVEKRTTRGRSARPGRVVVLAVRDRQGIHERHGAVVIVEAERAHRAWPSSASSQPGTCGSSSASRAAPSLCSLPLRGAVRLREWNQIGHGNLHRQGTERRCAWNQCPISSNQTRLEYPHDPDFRHRAEPLPQTARTRVRARHGRAPERRQPRHARADARLEFAEPGDLDGNEWAVDCDGFTVYVAGDSVAWLDGAEIDYVFQGASAQLQIRAPKIKGQAPGESASLVERVHWVVENEVNPQLASHGGRVAVHEVRADGVVLLRFGGGCHGCGMADVTLKQGIEKTLMAACPA
jgi:Fe/S biogenesis protein NfuA